MLSPTARRGDSVGWKASTRGIPGTCDGKAGDSLLRAAFEAGTRPSEEACLDHTQHTNGILMRGGISLFWFVYIFFSFHLFLFVCCLCTWILKGNIANPGHMKKSSIFVFSFTMFRNRSIPFDFFDLGVRESEGSDYGNTFLIELRVLVRWAN